MRKPPLLIEWYCEHDNELGRIVACAGWGVFRVDGSDDAHIDGNDRCTAALDRMINQAKASSRPIVMCASNECRVGSTWQRLRASLAARRALARERLRSRALLRTTSKISEKVRRAGGTVAFEWPMSCDGWRSKVCPGISRIIGLAPHQARVDRCALKADDGFPFLKKSWRVQISSIRASRVLHRICPKDHGHGRIEGSVAKGTGRYTIRVAQHFFSSLVEGLSKISEPKEAYPADRVWENDAPSPEDRVDPVLARAIAKLHMQSGHPENQYPARVIRLATTPLRPRCDTRALFAVASPNRRQRSQYTSGARHKTSAT